MLFALKHLPPNTDAVMLHQLSIGDDDEWIVSASIEEPYISLMMNNGQVLLLQVLKDKNGYELKILKELKVIMTWIDDV